MPNTHETLTSLFSDIADAIRAKTGGTADITADTFPTAIGTISTGTPLPTLTTPAAAGDILLHKEAIDGQGAKLTGTLDPLEDAELDPDSPPEIANGELAIELVHGQISVLELTYPVPDAIPENIVAGKTILGVTGTYEGGGAETITIVSPTTTCAEIADALRAAVSASITRFIAIRELPHGTNECVAVCWPEDQGIITIYRNDLEYGYMRRYKYSANFAPVPQGAVFKIYDWGD